MNSAPFHLEPKTEITVTDEDISYFTNGDGFTTSEAITIAILPEGENMNDKICYISERVKEEDETDCDFDTGTVEVGLHEATSSEGIILDEGGELLQIDEGSTVYTPPNEMAQLSYIAFNSQQLQPRVILPGMRKKWQETLKKKGEIVCPVPGCYLNFLTLSSFERHYRWCTGEKGEGVERCSYCNGQFLTTDCGIVEHVSQDHPVKLVEYKAFKRALALKNKVPPVKKKKDVVVYMNNSRNVDKVVSTNGSTATVMSSIPSASAIDMSEDTKPPTFSTKLFQIRKMSPNKDKKVKLKNGESYSCPGKRAVAKEARLKKAQNLKPRKNIKLEEEEEFLPRLRKFPGTTRIMQLPEGMKVYSRKNIQQLGMVIENSRNWNAPRRTYCSLLHVH